MIPFGSAGGCQNKVIEEAVTFAMVIFCGGVLPGQEYKTLKKKTERKPKVVKYLFNTCMRSGEANVDQNSTIAQSGPAGD